LLKLNVLQRNHYIITENAEISTKLKKIFGVAVSCWKINQSVKMFNVLCYRLSCNSFYKQRLTMNSDQLQTQEAAQEHVISHQEGVFGPPGTQGWSNEEYGNLLLN
jgi:hypothetical protein